MFRGRGVAERDSRAEDTSERGNSPLALLGVLGLVFGIVLLVALSEPDSLFAGGDDSEPDSAPEVRNGHPDPGFEPVSLLENNPVTTRSLRLSATNCELPELTDSAERMSDYYERGVRCLDQAWSGVLDGAGMERGTPEISSDSRTSVCGETRGETRPTAFYCEGTIHLPRQWVLSDLGLDEGSHLLMLAHEYGHHVQRLSGIMRASAERADDSEQSSSDSLRVTRRLELQAECFAGMFVARAVDDGVLDRGRAVSLVETPGSTKLADSHGSPANQRRWKQAGFRERNTAACATWRAPNDAVR
ncbi:neutral zinc metallopeptidase [Actinopolyspora halophila]|uniref:neutral zinc metallopeptidase n=1 Tax=Actinopolyspora halophila TaxID=1850 RepID=UPI00039EC7D5|nr:neutral zinc metallopeptidase [Actinopolyspora halophila]